MKKRLPLLILATATVAAAGLPHIPSESSQKEVTACIVLPGSSENVTRAFAVESGSTAGRLSYVSQAVGGSWHQRAALHPSGRYLYLSASVDSGPAFWRGIYAYAFRFDPATCAIGARISAVTMGTETSSIHRYYGLEVDPGGQVLYQTTEAVGEIRAFRVATDGQLEALAAFDATGDGRYTCAQTRRLEIHPNGRTLYNNCNNSDAGFGTDMAIQSWAIQDDGGLRLLSHDVMRHMNMGVFDPVVHPNGRWLYQPTSTVDPEASGGTGGYVLTYAISPDGTLAYRSEIRVDDPDITDRGPDAPVTFVTTFLIHPNGEYGYATVMNLDSLSQERGAHHILVYRVDPTDGSLSHVRTIETSSGGGDHHGGVLAGSLADQKLFLYTFISEAPWWRQGRSTGVLEQYEVLDDKLVPLDPVVFETGLKTARHPVAISR